MHQRNQERAGTESENKHSEQTPGLLSTCSNKTCGFPRSHPIRQGCQTLCSQFQLYQSYRPRQITEAVLFSFWTLCLWIVCWIQMTWIQNLKVSQNACKNQMFCREARAYHGASYHIWRCSAQCYPILVAVSFTKRSVWGPITRGP